MQPVIPVVLGCPEVLQRRVRYVLDTLMMALNLDVAYLPGPPDHGPWIWYGSDSPFGGAHARCLSIIYDGSAWNSLDRHTDPLEVRTVDGVQVLLPSESSSKRSSIPFDLIANAFFFLASLSERQRGRTGNHRGLYVDSVFARYRVPQDIVDVYVALLCRRIDEVWAADMCSQRRERWPDQASFVVVLSHDVDFVPRGAWENALQGLKTVARHLVSERDLGETRRAVSGLIRAIRQRRDPYGCVPELISAEKRAGVRSSFQVAVGHRHRLDVNYHVTDDKIRDYLRVIVDEGFDLCLHGSYRSSELPEWYAEEVELLSRRLIKPLGSRQHFLSFTADALYTAQEQNGILYDMSMGFPDRIGPRSGFSYPYFPFCLSEERPYDVVQMGLMAMDVTLRTYMSLKEKEAWTAVRAILDALREKGGSTTIDWHPIVFGGARDPGYDRLYWKIVEHVHATGGLATDGRTLNSFWRKQARRYQSFTNVQSSQGSMGDEGKIAVQAPRE